MASADPELVRDGHTAAAERQVEAPIHRGQQFLARNWFTRKCRPGAEQQEWHGIAPERRRASAGHRKSPSGTRPRRANRRSASMFKRSKAAPPRARTATTPTRDLSPPAPRTFFRPAFTPD